MPAYTNGALDYRFPVSYSNWYSRTTYNSYGRSGADILVTAPRGCGRGTGRFKAA